MNSGYTSCSTCSHIEGGTSKAWELRFRAFEKFFFNIVNIGNWEQTNGDVSDRFALSRMGVFPSTFSCAVQSCELVILRWTKDDTIEDSEEYGHTFSIRSSKYITLMQCYWEGSSKVFALWVMSELVMTHQRKAVLFFFCKTETDRKPWEWHKLLSIR